MLNKKIGTKAKLHIVLAKDDTESYKKQKKRYIFQFNE